MTTLRILPLAILLSLPIGCAAETTSDVSDPGTSTSEELGRRKFHYEPSVQQAVWSLLSRAHPPRVGSLDVGVKASQLDACVFGGESPINGARDALLVPSA